MWGESAKTNGKPAQTTKTWVAKLTANPASANPEIDATFEKTQMLR